MLPFDQPDFRTFLQVEDNPRIQLKYFPDWKDLGFSFVRDKNSHQIVDSISLAKVRFVDEDCHILRKALYEIGFNAKVRFIIEMLDRDNKTPSPTLYQYVPLFSGVVAMTEIEDEHVTDERGAEFVDVAIVDDNLSRKFENGLEKKFDIKPYGESKLDYDRIKIANTGEWSNEAASYTVNESGSNTNYLQILQLNITSAEQPAAKTSFSRTAKMIYDEYSISNLANNPNAYFLKCDEAIDVDVRIMLSGHFNSRIYIGNTANCRICLYVLNSDAESVVVSNTVIFDGNAANNNTSGGSIYENIYFDIDKTVRLHLNAGDKLMLCGRTPTRQLVHSNLYLDVNGGTNVAIEYQEKITGNKVVNIVSADKFIELLADKVTEKKTAITSNDNQDLKLSQVAFTSAGGMRGNSDAVIQSDLNSCLGSLRKVLAFGWEFLPTTQKSGYECEINIQPIPYFYDKSTRLASVGSAFNLQIKPYSDLIYNTIQVGYANVGKGEVNDLDEFNCKMDFSIPNIYSHYCPLKIR
jgi:hypothetical protein